MPAGGERSICVNGKDGIGGIAKQIALTVGRAMYCT